MDLGSYSWLTTIGTLPRMVSEALELWGTKEAVGDANNPEILKWAQEVGGDVGKSYKADSTHWCGLTMALVARRAGKTPPAKPLWALNWRKFGEPSGQPDLGDIVVFVRDGGGHVGLYVGEDASHYHVLGGNQSDAVRISRYSIEQFREARKPPYMTAPAAAIPVELDKDGNLVDGKFPEF